MNCSDQDHGVKVRVEDGRGSQRNVQPYRRTAPSLNRRMPGELTLAGECCYPTHMLWRQIEPYLPFRQGITAHFLREKPARTRFAPRMTAVAGTEAGPRTAAPDEVRNCSVGVMRPVMPSCWARSTSASYSSALMAGRGSGCSHRGRRVADDGPLVAGVVVEIQ